jgi:RNA polymerase sigma-70 factor (ECF subfamily)
MKIAVQTDKECVHRVLKGDLEAFSIMVSRYSPRMLNLALGIVHQREAAEDVVQDAFVKAYEKLGSWRGESSFSTWLYRITYTTAISSIRGQKLVSDDSNAAERTITPTDEDNGWEMTEENIAKMQHALEKLQPLDKTIVTLFYIEDKPVRDVAEICGESESNVKTRLHRARVRLRNLMMNEERNCYQERAGKGGEELFSHRQRPACRVEADAGIVEGDNHL